VKKIVSTTSPAQTLPTYFVNAGSQEVMAITGDVTAFNDPTADPEEVGMAPYSPVTGEGARGSILAEPTATRFNFQPISSDTPDGWLADSGNLQPTPAQRGWTLARTPVDRDHLGRSLYDTFIQLDATTWKLPVANGMHAVVIMCGDADSRAQTNNLMVNGVSVTDPTPYDGNPLLGYETGTFDGYALTVNVVDGFITITAAAGALNPKINFIEIGAGGTAIDVPTIARAKTAAAQATHDTAKPKPKLPPAVKRSIWGDYVDELISFTRALPRHSAVRYFAHANSHYSVVALTNATGSVVERYSYSAYGERSGASLLENDRGFSGQRIDIETNLYDVRARMYSPTLGRFITRDVAYSDGFNLYEYVQGSPSDLLDLFGFASWNTSNTTSMNLPVIGPAGAGVLATTIGSLSATTKCKCKKRVNKWYLDDTNVEFNINIDYWTDTNACKLHRPGLTYGWVKDRE
jgi:RHS repeat-associated protein